MASLQEIGQKMVADAEKAVKQALDKYRQYAEFIKILTQTKNIAPKNQQPQFITLDVPYMTVDGRVTICIDDHKESNEKFTFHPATFIKAPEGNTLLCSVTVDSKRGTATGTVEVGIGGAGADKTNPYANAETSALGRALGFLGYGLIGTGIASFEEMEGALGPNGNGGAAPANKTAAENTAGKNAGTNGGAAGETGSEGKASTAISAQIKIKTKTALVSAGYTDAEAAAKVNGAKTIDDINSLLQEAGAKKKANEEAAVNNSAADKGAQQPSDNGNQADKGEGAPQNPEQPADALKNNGSGSSPEGNGSGVSDEGKPVSAKEIIGLKKKLKEAGKTDDDLAKILPGVKTVGDYRKVIKEYGIAA